MQGWRRCPHLRVSGCRVLRRPWVPSCTWEGSQAWCFLGPRHTAEQGAVVTRGDANYSPRLPQSWPASGQVEEQLTDI